MIKISKDYITLGQLLKIEDFVQSGGETKQFLLTANITVNGVLENRRGRKIYPTDEVIVNGRKIMIE